VVLTDLPRHNRTCHPFRKRSCWRGALLLVLSAAGAWAQKYYTYVRRPRTRLCALAWGKTDGDNTIGRTSVSHGEATIKIDGRTLTSRPNTVTVSGLQPDHTYYLRDLDRRKKDRRRADTNVGRTGQQALFFCDWGLRHRQARAVSKWRRRCGRSFKNARTVTTPFGCTLHWRQHLRRLLRFPAGCPAHRQLRRGLDRQVLRTVSPLLARIPWFSDAGQS